MGASFAKHVVQVECYSRQVAEIFQKGKEGEENSHWRQHDADHPGGRQVHAVDKEAVQPPGQTDIRSQIFKEGVDGIEQQGC